MLSKLAVRRLTTLCAFMEKLPRSANKHFHMDSFFRHNGDEHHPFRDGKEIPDNGLTLCGATACAAGWGCSIPSFRRAGLRLVLRVDSFGDSYGDVMFKRANSREWLSLRKFFDISLDEVEYLFGPNGGERDDIATPKQWARMCRRYISAHKT